jgi:hypothetical protein
MSNRVGILFSSMIESTLSIFHSSIRTFLSLPSIKFLNEVAVQARAKGLRVALIAPSEKLKKQIDIYAQIGYWEIYRTQTDFVENRPSTPALREHPYGALNSF